MDSTNKLKRNILYLISFALLIKFSEPLFHFGVNYRLFFFYPGLFIAGLIAFRPVLINAWIELKRKPLRILLTIIVCFLVNIVLVTIINIFQGSGGGVGSANDHQVIKVMHDYSPIITLPILGFAGVVVEELVFRHILIGQLASYLKFKWAIWLCVILSSILFGFYHIRSVSDVSSVPIYIAAGVSFGIAYVISGRNILTTIGWHSISNLTSLAGIIIMTR